MPKYKMAELIIELNVRYNMTLDSCRPYEIFTDEAPHITVTVTDEDLKKERENDDEKRNKEIAHAFPAPLSSSSFALIRFISSIISSFLRGSRRRAAG